MMECEDREEVTEESYVKKVVEIAKDISIPQLTHAYVSHVSEDGNKLTVTTKWKQKNYQLAKNETFSVVYYYDKLTRNIEKVSPPLETNAILLECISPSLQQTAVIKKHTNESSSKQEFVLELWSNILNKRTKTVNLSSLDKHGQVHSVGKFARLSWSHDESKLVYVAEKKAAKTCGYFDKASEGQVPGDKYNYEGNWGEQKTEVTDSVLCIYSLPDESVEIVDGIPENVSPIQPVFGPDGTLVFAALHNQPFRLGSIYCPTRQCGIFLAHLSDDDKSVIELTKSSDLTANYNPQLNKAKTKMVFNRYKLSGVGDPHRVSNFLMVYNFKEEVSNLLCCEFNHGGETPIIHVANVRAPVLLCIGGKDARVPPSQGMHYFRVLKANGKVTKLLYYPSDCHPLANVETNADSVINICKWFFTHGTHSR